MSTVKFKITNITCNACVKLSTMALEKINGVIQTMIDATTGSVELVVAREVTWDEIAGALKSVGKEATQLS